MTRAEKVLAWLGGIAVAGLAAFGLVHHAASAQSGNTAAVTTADSGKTINLKVGDTLSMSLPAADPSGQQIWVPMPGSGATSTGGALFQLVNDSSTAGSIAVTLKAIAKGSTTVGYNLVNVSDPTTPLASFKINIVVS